MSFGQVCGVPTVRWPPTCPAGARRLKRISSWLLTKSLSGGIRQRDGGESTVPRRTGDSWIEDEGHEAHPMAFARLATSLPIVSSLRPPVSRRLGDALERGRGHPTGLQVLVGLAGSGIRAMLDRTLAVTAACETSARAGRRRDIVESRLRPGSDSDRRLMAAGEPRRRQIAGNSRGRGRQSTRPAAQDMPPARRCRYRTSSRRYGSASTAMDLYRQVGVIREEGPGVDGEGLLLGQGGQAGDEVGPVRGIRGDDPAFGRGRAPSRGGARSGHPSSVDGAS